MADSHDKTSELSESTTSNIGAEHTDIMRTSESATNGPGSQESKAVLPKTKQHDVVQAPAVSADANTSSLASYIVSSADDGSPTDDDDDDFSGPMPSTATFSNTTTSSIQLPPRLQRSSIPPPIDTENASKDADSSLRSKLLSTLSPTALDAENLEAKTLEASDMPDGISPLVFGDAGEGSERIESASTHCAHVGVSFSKNRRYRRTMEDAHLHIFDFDGVKGQSFLAIFDGHAGKQAAQWCSENFVGIFLDLKKEAPLMPIPELLNKAFVEADRRLATDVKTHSGCTAVVAFLQVKEVAKEDGTKFERILFCANVGDARAVLSRGGAAARLTYDHKGDDTHEIERIFESGGYVFNGRVNGVLAVTRALGDSSLKQFVIGNPFTTETKIKDDDDLLILACDGLWDVCTDQEAVDLVRSDMDPAHASQVLLDHALSNESTDNITTMVFRLPPVP